MNITDSTSELLQNAECIVIQFPLSRKERRKRALLAGGLAAGATFVCLTLACIVSEDARKKIATWN